MTQTQVWRRLAESAAAAAAILLAVLATSGAGAPDLRRMVAAAVAFAVLAAAAYAFHAVTFDQFRLTGRRERLDAAPQLTGTVRH